MVHHTLVKESLQYPVQEGLLPTTSGTEKFNGYLARMALHHNRLRPKRDPAVCLSSFVLHRFVRSIRHQETMRVISGLCCLVVSSGFQFPPLTSLLLHREQPKQTDSSFSKSKTPKAVAAAALAWSLFLGGPDPAHAVGEQVFNEVWGIVDENFVDNTYNGHDWKKTKDEYLKQLERGADEHDVTKKMLELLGDKYTRLLDKAYFESIWKYDAIGT